MLCPFTASNFWQPDLRLIVLIHDLQHIAFPEFFSVDQRLNREQHVKDAVAHAERVVCVSDFVRRAVREHTGLPDDRVTTIHTGVLHEFGAPGANSVIPAALGVKPSGYLLYPSNFWPHKNHERLFEALFHARLEQPGSDLKLVCTGAPNRAMHELRVQAEARLGRNVVFFPGHVDEPTFQTLLDQCAGLIYPSLYEGFGMPVLEAMARGKPVLCSALPSLQEVAGETAAYFDPTSVEQLAAAITALTSNRTVVSRRVACGRSRARTFGEASEMTQKYVNVMEEVLEDT
jgi:glycosyltransferase involved in cell wall biosynthesis